MTFPLLSNLHQQSGMSLTAFQELLGLRHQTWNDFLNGKPVPQGLLDDAHQLIADREFWAQVFLIEMRKGAQLPHHRAMLAAMDLAVDKNSATT